MARLRQKYFNIKKASVYTPALIYTHPAKYSCKIDYKNNLNIFKAASTGISIKKLTGLIRLYYNKFIIYLIFKVLAVRLVGSNIAQLLTIFNKNILNSLFYLSYLQLDLINTCLKTTASAAAAAAYIAELCKAGVLKYKLITYGHAAYI
ncbi:hypothetical protein BO82DRAFT_369539 [Aspergillus uvarum CBS 121591]|uniref:Uncharacterized protein n=1 Tax=Aspergillus uvarum CBS 121591 TaxID=1448315 RepID=A0A319BVI6_9EURO|nr:hypothetical protein BO82DRAFT_369539 [Aspergillus uvarum CBS 121591]PYH76237.1 hypothetical protein BO82DRAFT_369539 [Aspergillus uvarum CBS 121591]